MRRVYGGVAAVSAVLFAALAVLVKTGRAAGFNTAVAAWSRGIETPWLTGFFRYYTWLGDWIAYVPVALLFLFLPRARKALGVPAAVMLTAAALSNWLLKWLFAVARPNENQLTHAIGYSFPSGHAMIGTAFVGFCACLLLRSRYRRSLRITVFALSAVFLLLMGYSRVYLGVHTAADILAGHCAGVLCIAVGLALTERSQKGEI